jgi:glycine C-acetyltransferase
MADLEAKLLEASSARFKMIATDGIFSMDGYIAKLEEICDLADKHDAMVMIDDSHAGRIHGQDRTRDSRALRRDGSRRRHHRNAWKSTRRCERRLHERKERDHRVASPAIATVSFSNSVAPPIVAASIAAIDMLTRSTELRDKLMDNTRYFREKIAGIGLEVLPGEHPIVPIMFGDAKPAVKMAEKLLEKGVYVIPFSFPSCRREGSDQDSSLGRTFEGGSGFRDREV